MIEQLQQLQLKDYRVVAALVTLLVGYLLYRVASKSLRVWAQRGNLGELMEQRVRTMLRLLLLVITCLLAVQQAGAFDHAWALLSAVVTTVAIGFFAIWSVLSNIVCSLLIVLFRPFRLGDWVEIVEGPAPFPGGYVADMNLLFVSLADQPLLEANPGSADLVVRIPNTLFFQKVVRCRLRSKRSNTFF